MRVLALLVLLAACDASSSSPPDARADAAGPDACALAHLSVCNPIEQVGCESGQRCTYFFDADGVPIDLDLCDIYDGATPGCIPDGTIALGAACTIDPELQHDDCVRGAFCLDGTCRAYCIDVPDSCDLEAGEQCQTIDGNTSPRLGGCVPAA